MRLLRRRFNRLLMITKRRSDQKNKKRRLQKLWTGFQLWKNPFRHTCFITILEDQFYERNIQVSIQYTYHFVTCLRIWTIFWLGFHLLLKECNHLVPRIQICLKYVHFMVELYCDLVCFVWYCDNSIIFFI